MACGPSYEGRRGQMGVSFAHHPAVTPRQNQDRPRGNEVADLKKDEYRVSAFEGDDTNEGATRQPHGPGATAHSS
jgi:hypothetical protein